MTALFIYSLANILQIIAKGYRQLVVGHLPDYDSCCYTEEDLANVLIPFGFQYAEDRIYVLPQSRMVGLRLISRFYCCCSFKHF